MTTEETSALSVAEIRRIATEACLACGGTPEMAKSLVDATLSAACNGRPEVGFPHLVDYLHSLREGRIDGQAIPQIDQAFPAFIHADARGGTAQLGFDLAFENLIKRAQTYGIAVFTQKNSYTAGELGYYVRRLARCGLVSLAAANAHAMMAAAIGEKAAFGTNPIAFGAPRLPPHAPLVIDQATSATAFLNIVSAAAGKSPVPSGWAIDDEGRPTTDPEKAMLGALLPFGGGKGANIALMVEVLAAGLTGADWSLDAGHFRQGDRCPNTGLTVVAVSPAVAGPDFEARLDAQLSRLAELGVHIPGTAARRPPAEEETIEIDTATLSSIRNFIP